jgi:hypothetical protein
MSPKLLTTSLLGVKHTGSKQKQKQNKKTHPLQKLQLLLFSEHNSRKDDKLHGQPIQSLGASKWEAA